MKTYDPINFLPQQTRMIKEQLRVVQSSMINLLMTYSSTAELTSVKSVKISHNELAGLRFKLAQAMTLLEQCHAVTCELDLDLVEIATKKKVPIAVDDTDLML
jgi:acyl-CoA thioesterase FadM